MYSAAIPASARLADCLYATGHWLLHLGRAAEAKKVLRVLLLSAPHDERSWVALGTAHERDDEPELALEVFSAGMAVTSPGVRCAVARARVLKELGRAGEVTEALEQAWQIALDSLDEDMKGLVRTEVRS